MMLSKLSIRFSIQIYVNIVKLNCDNLVAWNFDDPRTGLRIVIIVGISRGNDLPFFCLDNCICGAMHQSCLEKDFFISLGKVRKVHTCYRRGHPNVENPREQHY